MRTPTPARADIADRFREVVPALTPMEAVTEANRCLFCSDAPCAKACPTGIDVPMFIRKIATGNLKGSAKTILEANPLGASCARICPTEELCVGACVLNDLHAPIMIGELQRYATDYVMENDVQLFEKGPSNGLRVAIVGAGPAALGAARELARFGYRVTIFESKKKAGGLNTYGVAPFRLPQSVSLWEVKEVEKLGVEIRTGVTAGIDIAAEQLSADYDAVLLAVGMGGIQRLDMEGEHLPGVMDALGLIEKTKDGDPNQVSMGRSVAVIGAGNTAIDGAVTAKRLGAEFVQILYRRTDKEMTAYPFEYESAKQEGIEFRWLTAPQRILGAQQAEGIECVHMELGNPDERGRRIPRPIPDSEFVIEVDTVILAVGQSRLLALFEQFGIKHKEGVVLVDENFRTSREKIYAAGDCIFSGGGSNEATVVLAVEQGKQAAYAIHEQLTQNSESVQQALFVHDTLSVQDAR